MIVCLMMLNFAVAGTDAELCAYYLVACEAAAGVAAC